MTEIKVSEFLEILPSTPETDVSMLEIGKLLTFLSYRCKKDNTSFSFSVIDGRYFATTHLNKIIQEFDTLGEALTFILNDIVKGIKNDNQ